MIHDQSAARLEYVWNVVTFRDGHRAAASGETPWTALQELENRENVPAQRLLGNLDQLTPIDTDRWTQSWECSVDDRDWLINLEVNWVTA